MVPTTTTVGGLRSASECSTEVQKLIAKYGLAAHLAVLAAAPLFLFPFFPDKTITAVILWLSVPAAIWTLLEPSIRVNEVLSDARRRVIRAIFRDLLFWASLVMVLFTGFRAINTGIMLSYDAELSVWRVANPLFPSFPGVAGETGDLPFAAAVALLVLLLACRHALGKRARMAFLLLATSFAGLAAMIELLLLSVGSPDIVRLLPEANGAKCSFLGFSFGLYLIGGIVSLAAVFERRWSKSVFLLFPALSGTSAGVFAFAPLHVALPMLVAALLMLVCVIAYAGSVLQAAERIKLVLIGLSTLILGGFFAVLVLPMNVTTGWVAAVTGLRLTPVGFWEIREALSFIAFKSWIAHLWAGTGLASFPLDFRFNAQAADWALLPHGAVAVANGWRLALVEQGLVGIVFFALPFGFLLFTYVRRSIGGIRAGEFPHPACFAAPLVLALFVIVGFFDCSPLRAEAVVAAGAMMAVSAAAFPRMRRGQ